MTTREIVLDGGSPWGFRLHGGADVNQPLRISRVNPGSKAALRGIREGDFITSINGQSTKDISNADAHALLKNSGDTLKLGLNEDTNGSPKRRQYKTVHQETHSETVKKSSTTSYTLTSSKTISQEVVNDLDTSKSKENPTTNGQSNSRTHEHPVASQRSTLSSNCSSSSSNPSTYIDAGDATTVENTTSAITHDALAHTTASNFQDSNDVLHAIMSDNNTVSSSSRSRRKRSRNNSSRRKKPSKIVCDNNNATTDVVTVVEAVACSEKMENLDESRQQQDDSSTTKSSNIAEGSEITENKTETVSETVLENYRVDSPKLQKTESSPRRSSNGKMPPKSKSLDDDEMLKIQELSEASESEDKTDSKAIVSEAESDAEKDATNDLDESRELEPCDMIEEISAMSAEEELTLRNFLGSLNLVNSPEDAANQACETNTVDSIKAKKAKRRAALEQYFFPVAQNPRFLDVINEEGSDTSDKEHKSTVVHHLKQGTPETDAVSSSTSSPTVRRKQIKADCRSCAPVANPAMLVGIKIVEPAGDTLKIHSSNVQGEMSNAEVVYLDDDSSGGETPDPKSDTEENSNGSHVAKTDEENNLSSDTSSMSELVDSVSQESEVVEEKSQTCVTLKKNSELVSETSKTTYEKHWSTNSESSEKQLIQNDSSKEHNVTVKISTEDNSPVAKSTSEVATSPEVVEKTSELFVTLRRNDAAAIKATEKFNTDDRDAGSSQQKHDYGNVIMKQYVDNEYESQNDSANVPQVPNKCDTAPKEETPTSVMNNQVQSCLQNEISSQLTPPPTPVDNMSPKNETESETEHHFSSSNIKPVLVHQTEELCNTSDRLPVAKASSISNVFTLTAPSPSPSLSSDSSSRATSLCTAKYNPMSSSVADISSITKDEELLKNPNDDSQPPTLRDICLSYLISQPFGTVVLQELADVALTIQNLTNKLSTKIHHAESSTIHPNVSGFVPSNTTNLNKITSNEFFDFPVRVANLQMPDSSKWIGMPTNEDHRVSVDLSPSQKEELERSRKTDREPQRFMDLQGKYISRTSHYEETKTQKEEKREIVQITSTDKDVKTSSHDNVDSRLLAIIRSSDSTANKPISVNMKSDDQSDNYLYFVDRNVSDTLPSKKTRPSINSTYESARLKAKDLTEWLHLARNRSTSESDLLTATAASQHRNSTNSQQGRPGNYSRFAQRRTSLPQEFYQRQMQYLLEKEREIQKELEQLEEEKRKLTAEMAPSHQQQDFIREFNPDDFHISRKGDFAENKKSRPTSMPTPGSTEFFRQQMYEEYMGKIAQREERKQHKVIKVTSRPNSEHSESLFEARQISGIEDEFMDKVRERQKLGKLQELEQDQTETDNHPEDESSEPVLVMDGDSLKGARELPRHLQEFVDITKHAAQAEDTPRGDGVWSPGQKPEEFQFSEPSRKSQNETHDPLSPVWTPKSATSSPTVERKEYRPVKFESPVLGRKNFHSIENTSSAENLSRKPPWKAPATNSDTGVASSSSTLQKRLPTSHSSPASGFNDFSTSRLPKAQNPTITLLQKAREGQLPKGASYIEVVEQTNQRRPQNDRGLHSEPGEIRYQIKNEYTSESDSERPRRTVDLAPRKFEGIGPTTRDGMPLILRSEVKDANQSKWYKKMYDTIHKQKPHREEYVTVKYKQRRGNYPYNSGYLSEPEPGAYDSDFTDYKYATLDRRRLPARQDKENESKTSSTLPRNIDSSTSRIESSDVIRHGHDPYKNQPGRIENYIPGHSSISEKEAKEWWDEVMDIFDGWLDDNTALPSYDYMFARALARSHLEQQRRVPQQKSFINQALKESGYESDSTLVFRRKDDTAHQLLSPQEQKDVYKVIQQGGDIPLHGLRKPAPERPKEEDEEQPELEYFPISPTLTRVRIHKNQIKPQREIICYPVTVHPHPSTIFANVKRTAPSSPSNIPIPPPLPPSPPRRRSSRNNSTLRLISTMKVKTEKSPICKRHETCFTTTSDIDNTKVKYLRDKITYKLAPGTKSKDSAKDRPKLKISKTVTASPDRKSRIVSTITSSKDPKTSLNRVHSQTSLDSDTKSIEKCCTSRSRSAGSSTIQKPCRKCTGLFKKAEFKVHKSDKNLDKENVASTSTFGTEKRKADLTLPKIKPEKRPTLANSPVLLSPTEVKRAVQNQIKNLPSGTVFKKSTALLSSAKNNDVKSPKSATLPIKVGFSEKGKAILRSTLPRSSDSKEDKLNEVGTSSNYSKKIISTIGRNPMSSKGLKPLKTKLTSCSSSAEAKKLKKSKKEEINGEIAKRKKTEKSLKELIFNKPVKCAGRALGSEIVKKLKKMEADDNSEFGSYPALVDIQKQKDAIQTDFFYQHLFLKDFAVSPVPSTSSRNTWLIEKAYQLQRRRSSMSEPTISAMKVYLKHTKPVTDSKFKSLDASRSRSASPKSVTWENNRAQQSNEKRSSSLPPKLVFSQTSRPVSPKIERRMVESPTPPTSPKPQKLVFSQTSRPVSPKVERRFVRSPTPPQSPLVMRSPSTRRIMQFRHSPQQADPIHETRREKYDSPFGSKTELSLYTCPSLSQSTGSIDSCDRREYQSYVRDLLRSSRRSSRFKELNEFYAAIEKFGQLEQTASSMHSKPRRKFEEEIIDYDRWKEVRTKEKAERELQSLVVQLKEDQKEKGFLFCPKEIDSYRWRRDRDRGLRVKEKSVENIKDEFEKLKTEDSELDSKRKQELIFAKDTYKPLWRGDSVLSLASRMVERRSQSESRVASARQRLIDSERILTHGIGSRIWSSLSMEQVNTLKTQLSEIYTQSLNRQNQNVQISQYSIEVPKERHFHSSELTVRRNSDMSDRIPSKPDDSFRMNFLSESDKKLLSQTLSKEVLDHMTKRKKNETALPLVLAKETRGATAAADANLKPPESLTYHPQRQQQERGKTSSDDSNADTEKGEQSQPKPALVKTDATTCLKTNSTSETESGTDESTKTVIFLGNNNEIKKKVEYFENAAEIDKYTPVVYKPSENQSDASDSRNSPDKPLDPPDDESSFKRNQATSQSYQDLKELFGERDLARFATVPLSATRKSTYTSPQRPQLRASNLRTPSPPISETTSQGSFSRSRSLSPHWDEPLALVKAGEVRRLKHRFEYVTGVYPPRISFAPRRCSSDPSLHKRKLITIPGSPFGDVEFLKSKYEYPAVAGRGRSRLRRGGVVSPTFLRAEDRLMPHINIISKIANLYTKKQDVGQEKSTSMEELAQILGCPVGEVQKIRQKFDACSGNISILGQMFTSSPNIKELRDIAPYLAASWIAHRYPKPEDNTRSLSSPEASPASQDTSLVLKKRPKRPKSASPPRPPKKSSILKEHPEETSSTKNKLDPKTQPLSRYQPEPERYKSWWTSTHTRPSVSFQEAEPPVPPPKGHHGTRNPQRPESPRKYVENEVTIHYKTPVRQEIKEYLSEDELAYRQAEAMKKIYQEERRRKYLQELQDINSRRHTDNFIPSQKSPIPLNRYDDFETLPAVKPRPRSPERRLMARALYNFVGQTARELTFRKGDLIYVRRQVDKNWYEGELNAMVGLFPVNYVEIVTHDHSKTTPRKSHEGQARAKFNFVAQTHLELSLVKGELVVITRRVDDNWFEGKIGGRKGIFPVSYVEVLIDPSDRGDTYAPPLPSKPVASPAAHSLLLNGSAGGKESMGSHSYTPSISANQMTTSGSYHHAKPVKVATSPAGNYGSLNRNGASPINQALHIETQSEPVPYRALYKYVPQNDDELELLEGDTVYVLEKCDDGWYVGSSERTGAFGTFPGNYVEKI